MEKIEILKFVEENFPKQITVLDVTEDNEAYFYNKIGENKSMYAEISVDFSYSTDKWWVEIKYFGQPNGGEYLTSSVAFPCESVTEKRLTKLIKDNFVKRELWK